ncbi:hypothetical protein CRG98_003885 [Punica granatum]|uniref:Pentatricopeptide repeat-containing protein n=2 Tax=Punica granatum TaxID=22663 RepID=A0A2I0L4X3_PUNGR|nr:hypothetical protein CRG98_003885 [Punica granatum]
MLEHIHKNRPSRALDIFRGQLQLGFSGNVDEATAAVALKACNGTGLLVDARKVFDEMPTQYLVSWGAMISGYTQEGNYGSESIRLLIGMLREGMRADHVSLAGAVWACSQEGNFELGRQIHGLSVKIGQGKHRQLKNGMCQEALVMYFSAIMESYQPKPYTFGSVLSAIGSAESISLRQDQRCRYLIIKFGLDSDSIFWGSLLDMHAKRGSISESLSVFSQTSRRSQFAWTAIISAHARHGDNDSVSLLGSCRVHGKVEMAERVVDALMEIEPMESGSYVLMSNLYAEKGHWEKVAEIRKGIRERGVVKEIRFSRVDDGSLSLHGFSSGDMSHRQSEDIFSMAHCFGLEMQFLIEKDDGEDCCNIGSAREESLASL